MARTVITTSGAPAAIGPYSQGISATGRMVFCSGQLALRPDGTFADGDAATQTRQIMANLKAVLAAGGATFDDVVKVTIFLIDLNDYAAVNAVYAESFGAAPPARAAVEVSRLPRDARVEIECIAVVGS